MKEEPSPKKPRSSELALSIAVFSVFLYETVYWWFAQDYVRSAGLGIGTWGVMLLATARSNLVKCAEPKSVIMIGVALLILGMVVVLAGELGIAE